MYPESPATHRWVQRAGFTEGSWRAEFTGGSWRAGFPEVSAKGSSRGFGGAGFSQAVSPGYHPV